MAQNTTVELLPKRWNQLTNGDVTAITFQVLNSSQSVLIKATVGAVPPTDQTGSAKYERGEGELVIPLASLFPGVAGANRVYAYCEVESQVFVSHA